MGEVGGRVSGASAGAHVWFCGSEAEDASERLLNPRDHSSYQCGKSDEVKNVGTVSGIICLSTAQT